MHRDGSIAVWAELMAGGMVSIFVTLQAAELGVK